MEVIKRLFGGSRKPELERPSQIDPPPDSRTFQVDNAQATARRELVRVVTRDTQRACGIPDGWMESLVLLELGRGAQTFVHLRLVVKHWDVRLLTYAVAFQTLLMKELQGFDAAAHEWLLSVSWQYQVGDNCPFPAMPPPDEWLVDAQTQKAPVAAAPLPSPPSAAPKPSMVATGPQAAPAAAGPVTSVDLPLDVEEPDEVSEDLARLFAIRDANLPGGDKQH